MAEFTLRPHTFIVERDDGANQVPPISDSWLEILSADGNAQSGASGGIGDESEAMNYDYVLFYDFESDDNGDRIQDIEIEVEDRITVDMFGLTKIGTVKKWLPGQLSNRIWFNEISQ